METIDKTLNVYNQISKLKDEERLRRGWITRNIPGRIESDAEHCFAMSSLAILLNLQFSLNLDMEKVLTMINIHEYGEVEVGDIIPKDGITEEQKHEMELAAIIKMLSNHPGSSTIIELWNEFEEAKSDEAIFVLLLDKFQSVLQAKEYSEKYQRPEVFEEFNNWYLDTLKKCNEEHLPQPAKLLHL